MRLSSVGAVLLGGVGTGLLWLAGGPRPRAAVLPGPEQQARDAVARSLTAAFHRCEVGVLVCAGDRVHSVNPAVTRYTGLPASQLAGHQTAQLPASLQLETSFPEGEGERTVAGTGRVKVAATIRQISWLSTPVCDEQGAPACRLVLLWPGSPTAEHRHAVAAVSSKLRQWMTDPVNSMVLDVEAIDRYLRLLTPLAETLPMAIKVLDRFEQHDADESILDDPTYERCRSLLEQLRDPAPHHDAQESLAALEGTIHQLMQRIATFAATASGTA